MKTLLATTSALILAACAPGGNSSTPGECLGTATYAVTFEAAWTAGSANAPIPANAHFSPAFGAVHSADTALYRRGSAASAGIKQMAETGATSVLEGEAEALGARWGKGARLDATGTTRLTLQASQSADQLTLVSMIAPSPDWYVGKSGLSLCQGGAWISNYSADLATYDAGTDSGTGFTSADAPTRPASPIRFLTKDLTESAQDGGAVFGRFSVTKL